MGIAAILQTTGFKTFAGFVRETTPEQRRLIAKSIEAYHEQQADAGGGGSVPGNGGGPPGL